MSSGVMSLNHCMMSSSAPNVTMACLALLYGYLPSHPSSPPGSMTGYVWTDCWHVATGMMGLRVIVVSDDSNTHLCPHKDCLLSQGGSDHLKAVIFLTLPQLQLLLGNLTLCLSPLLRYNGKNRDILSASTISSSASLSSPISWS